MRAGGGAGVFACTLPQAASAIRLSTTPSVRASLTMLDYRPYARGSVAERGAAAERRLHLNLAVVELHRAIHERQADAAPCSFVVK